MPAIYALYVINKSGGLIYNKVRSVYACINSKSGVCSTSHWFFSTPQEFLNIASNSLNDTLRLASIWQAPPHFLQFFGRVRSFCRGCRVAPFKDIVSFALRCSAVACAPQGKQTELLQALAARDSSPAGAGAGLHRHRAAARGYVRPALLSDADGNQVPGGRRA